MKRFRVTVVIWKEGMRFVSKCPELGVASYGSTPEKARSALEEAVILYLENAEQLGILSDLTPALSSPVHFTSNLDVAVA